MSAVRILLVCTGKICRSPLAAQLLRARFAALGLQTEVHSAGTRAMVASPMTDEAATLALKHGANSVEHSARQLTEQLVGDADLILTATRDHRREVVTLLPRPTRYTFTLNQFARLVSATETEPSASAFSAFVAAIAATRGLHPSPNPPTLDGIDAPYRQPAAVYTRVAAIIDDSVTTIAAAPAPPCESTDMRRFRRAAPRRRRPRLSRRAPAPRRPLRSVPCRPRASSRRCRRPSLGEPSPEPAPTRSPSPR